MKKKPVKYEVYWMVFDKHGSGVGNMRINRSTAISDFIRGEPHVDWASCYHRGYRCLKVGVVK